MASLNAFFLLAFLALCRVLSSNRQAAVSHAARLVDQQDENKDDQASDVSGDGESEREEIQDNDLPTFQEVDL